MKIVNEYDHDAIYGICQNDFIVDTEYGPYNCFKSFIYKLTKSNEIVFERPVIGIKRDENGNMHKLEEYESFKMQLADEFNKNFNIIGDLGELINYLENEGE